MHNIEKITIHAGVFHADDILSVCIAQMLNPAVEYRRFFKTDGLDCEADSGEIVADIGFGRYDHHGRAAKTRADGGPHSACTLLWQDFGEEAVMANYHDLSPEQAKAVAETVAAAILNPVADGDNGIFTPGFTINQVVSQFNPNWDAIITNTDVVFAEALAITAVIFRKTVERCVSEVRAQSLVKEALDRQEDGVVIFDKFVPWQKWVCADPKTKLVVFPSNRGGWNAQLVPAQAGSRETRSHVPETWKGLSGEAAKAACQGMTFCHAGGFLLSFETREDAINTAKKITALDC